jgi:lipoate synthase/lipoate-protein ligase B
MLREITSSEEVTLPVYLGSNDGIQVWLNGERILANDIGRKAAPDQEVAQLNLKKGVNTFLMKVNNRAAAHAFYFSIHPGGGASAKRVEELWRLLARDFPDETARRQMRWERRDNIWAEDATAFDPPSLAAQYAQATRKIHDLPHQAEQIAATVADEDALQKVRELYYRSRLFDELVANVTSKLQLAKGQFNYLENRYKQKMADAQWQQYRDKLASLLMNGQRIVALARQANSAAVEKLGQWGTELTSLYQSQLPKAPQPAKVPFCEPFDLKQVRLLDSPFKTAMELDRKYLHDLDSDRLLHMFRVTAGIPSSAEQLGGWEKRELRGHTMGHYLTACALMYSSTGDQKLKAKADGIVAELAKCQKAFGNGYLSAFPEEGIKRVIYRTGGWWAPWYTLHKIYAGLIDMYTHCGNEQALKIAVGMADWAKSHLDNLNDEQIQHMLEFEFGGMNEVFCNLYAVTKNPDHLALARQFDHDLLFEPLAHFQDKLTGLHANTQVPKIVGAAREFELTGEPYYYNIATFFWDQVANARSYCTGGTSHHEHWRTEPYKLAEELSPTTQESCVTYNMLKLTRLLFCWHPEAGYADFYERALFNSILSTQDLKTGMMMYFVPLASGYWKIFNTPNDSFWCCTGTGIENHAKYGDSIYFHDDNGVYINLLIASELHWPDKGARIRQETSFPEQEGTVLTIKVQKPVELSLWIRVPYWATKGMTLRLNGHEKETKAQPGTYITRTRVWKDGDRVEIDMPMSLHLHRMPDDPTLAAIMYGPLVLAGELGTDGLDVRTVYSQNQGRARELTTMPTTAEKTESAVLTIRDCGLADYREVLQLQHRLREQKRLAQIADTVLIVEHPPVITLGARQSANKLRARREDLARRRIDVVDIRRGGGTTAHSPGQLVVYPILRLPDLGLGISEYIRKLEVIGIELLAQLAVPVHRRKGFPGLWVGEKKIASVGVRVSKSVTYHGMAINIQNDLAIFDYIVPCGLDNVRMTSVLQETGRRHSMDRVKEALSKLLIKHFSQNGDDAHQALRKLPEWLHRPLPAGDAYNRTSNLLNSLALETICVNANCPNRGECWGRGTATVLILGNVCTRNCKFCSVATGKPLPPDPAEPSRIAQMAKEMDLKYLVMTSVNRDDLPDGGAGHFRDCIEQVRKHCPNINLEILTPDFRGYQRKAVRVLREALPFVFAHNVETVPSLYRQARAGGDYQCSLNLLKMVKDSYGDIVTKSSIMLGLGETDAEVEDVLRDLRQVGCDRITIGQYLKPSSDSLEVVEYVHPEKFAWWKEKAVEMGFSWVCSEPFARSSYQADQAE